MFKNIYFIFKAVFYLNVKLQFMVNKNICKFYLKNIYSYIDLFNVLM